MKRKNTYFVALVLFALLMGRGEGMAQRQVNQSVLSEHTWHRMAVAQEGVYKLDYATLEAMNVDMKRLNPNEIRVFGNLVGMLAEKNSEWRPDDLTELAIYVSGADDGVFDTTDYVLFYGQEPTCWKLMQNSAKVYQRERNYYTDTTYYYLCVDSGIEGLRIGHKASQPLDDVTAVITQFPDFAWHEEELFSPYNMGRNWFGESLTIQDSLFQIDFVLPNLVKDKPVHIKAEMMGRIRKSTLHYDFWANGNLLVNDGIIGNVDNNDYLYGKSSSCDRMILSDSDTISVGLRLRYDNNGPLLFLDYVELYFWRQLKRVGSFFPFRLEPKQLGSGNSAVWVQNVGSDFLLWDVTQPLRPMVQEGTLSAGNFVFAINDQSERRYAMFRPAVAKHIDSWTAIPNQNLHSITTADMLIITHPLFREQAEVLARFHQEEDGMTSVVVDVNEVFNEFSTGTVDPAGIRNFIRMVYSRSGKRLKYVTLFGRPSFDVRNLKGYDRNFVPCYEAKTTSQSMMKEGTDDFFGLMDDNEGQDCSGRMDIGIGRIPVSTVAEAEAVMQKIRQYNDLANNHGDWKLTHLMVADDESRSYIVAEETYDEIMDTVCPDLNSLKVYCGAYPHVTTTSGVHIPQATTDMVDALNDGVLMMSYSGHGGVKGLTGDNVFNVSDIVSLKNGEHMPFVFTATCEFSKYDDPLLLSAGEQLFLLPENGAIAMLTTTRPTNGSTNLKIGKSLMDVLCRRDEEGRGLRFGDIYQLVKSSPTTGFTNTGVCSNINYVLFGDPALRLAIPQEEVVTLKVNGRDAHIEEIEIHALSMVSLEGEIRKANGLIDTQFNGEIWVTFFDKKVNVAVPHDDGVSMVSYHKDKLYQGRCSVNAGKFTVSFQVPSDINPDNGLARFSFYAYDSIRNIDAMGMFDDIVLGGVDPSMPIDDEGPQISFYWNSPDFQNGDMVERQGTLIAELYDAQGIYHYDFSLGRDMVLNSNLAAYDNLILNNRYEPALNDFRRGRLSIPVSGLAEGIYEFDLKVWDMQNNSSTAHLWVVVGGDVFLAGVRNYPNPFSDETRITMTHVGSDGNFRVQVEVFDLMGRNVARLSKQVTSTGEGQLEPVIWNGRDLWGNPLPTGIYLYRLTLTGDDGYSRTVNQRMMISR